MSISIVETGATIGAEIRDVDLRKPIDDATFEAIRSAFYKYGVIYLRGAEFDDDDHIRFSALWGEVRKLKVDPNDLRTASGNPQIVIVSNVLDENGKHIGSYDSGLFWHTDGAYYAETNQHRKTLLHALEVPEKDGRALGDTTFASATAAYDALPERMKKRLEGLQAVHSLAKRHQKTIAAGHTSWRTAEPRKVSVEAEKKNTESVHPVVKVHPITGRKCLYVSDAHTVRITGLPEDESHDLIEELVTHITRPQFLYSHSWRVHDLLMWDDIATQHKATFDYALPQRRVMHRTIVLCER